MRQYIEIGSSPADEDCLPAGSPRDKQRAECEAYMAGIKAKLGEPPEKASLAIKWNSHDFGQYAEVICFYDDDDESATDYAFKCESDAPVTWEECGTKPSRDDTDPAFAESELIPVPKDWVSCASVPDACDLKTYQSPIMPCQSDGKLVNEFYDARLNSGQWAHVCPKCFARYGVGLGVGKGQKFRKATDGNFYVVEGGIMQVKCS